MSFNAPRVSFAGGRAKREVPGFTLVELMICLAVIAILLSIMLPAYQRQMIKSRRSVGVAALLTVLARQEHHFVMNKHYASGLKGLGYNTNVIAIGSDGEVVPATSVRRAYSLSIQNALPEERPQRFVLKAMPQLGQNKDLECGELEVSSVGVKSARYGLVADCW